MPNFCIRKPLLCFIFIATPLSASIEMPTKARSAGALLETEEFMVIPLVSVMASAARVAATRCTSQYALRPMAAEASTQRRVRSAGKEGSPRWSRWRGRGLASVLVYIKARATSAQVGVEVNHRMGERPRCCGPNRYRLGTIPSIALSTS